MVHTSFGYLSEANNCKVLGVINIDLNIATSKEANTLCSSYLLTSSKKNYLLLEKDGAREPWVMVLAFARVASTHLTPELPLAW